MHLHYTVDSLYKWEGWMVTREDDEAFGYLANEGDNLCPLGLNSGWEYQLSSGWEADLSLGVGCGGDAPPTDPTQGDTTASDRPTVPGPGGDAAHNCCNKGERRTVVYTFCRTWV